MRCCVLALLVGCSFGSPAGQGAIDAPPGADAPTTTDAAVDGTAVTPDAVIDARPPNVCAEYMVITGAGPSTFRSPNAVATYSAAKQDCENDVPGVTRLAIPQTLAEADALWRSAIAPGQASPYIRVGITRVGGEWVGDDGSMPPLFFADGQPNGNDATILAGPDGEYYDFRAEAVQEYVCECPP